MAVSDGTRRAARGGRGGRGGQGAAGRGAQGRGNQPAVPPAGAAQLTQEQLAQVAQVVNNSLGTAINTQIAPLIQNVVAAALAAANPGHNPPPPPAQNPNDDLEAMLVQAQVADAGHRHAIRASGIASVDDLQLLRKPSEQRTEFFKRLSKDHKINLGLQQQSNLYAAGWWIYSLMIRQQAVTPAHFDATARQQALAACQAQRKPTEPTYVVYFDPKDPLLKNWFTFFEQFAQMLDGLCGELDSTTLRYIAAPIRTPGTPVRPPFTESDYQLPTVGFAFNADNSRVAALLVQALSKDRSAQLSCDAELTAGDGRGAILKLVTEREGTSHVNIRVETAKADLEKLTYLGNETKFKFADFINQTRLLYRILNSHSVHRVHTEIQVQETFRRMKLKDANMEGARMNAFRNHPTDLDKFAETFANELAIL